MGTTEQLSAYYSKPGVAAADCSAKFPADGTNIIDITAVTGAGQVSWSNNGSSFASITSPGGVVTGVSPGGPVTISGFTYGNPSLGGPAVAPSVAVTVVGITTPIVTLTGTTAYGGTGGDTRSAYYGEAGPSAHIDWTATNNPSICMVSQDGVMVGKYEYPATTQYPLTTGVIALTNYRVSCTAGNAIGDSNVVSFDAPSIPTVGTVSCNTAGTQATLNWTLPGGYTSAYLRAYQTPPTGIDYPSACSPLKTEPSGLCNDGYTGTSYPMTVTPNTQYFWYAHTKDNSNANWSNAVSGGTFTCVPATANNAKCMDVSVPPSVPAGGTFTANVTMRNTGNTTWLAGGTNPYKLGSQTPQDNLNWGVGRVWLGSDQAPNPNLDVTFPVNATAPPTPGSYAFDWKMVQEGIEWFGATCTGGMVTVVAPPTPPSCSTLTANPSDINLGSPVTLTWSCQNATSCTASVNTHGFATGESINSTDTATPTSTGQANYGMSCTGPGGTASFYFPPVTVRSTNVYITASALRVKSGSTVDVKWKATDVADNSCNVTGPNLPPSPPSPSRTNFSSVGTTTASGVPITAQSTYTISCTPKVGSGPVTSSVTVNIVPIFQTF